MGICCEAAEYQAPVEEDQPAALKIYGDMFSADTRALISICKHTSIDYEFQLVD